MQLIHLLTQCFQPKEPFPEATHAISKQKEVVLGHNWYHYFNGDKIIFNIERHFLYLSQTVLIAIIHPWEAYILH